MPTRKKIKGKAAKAAKEAKKVEAARAREESPAKVEDLLRISQRIHSCRIYAGSHRYRIGREKFDINVG